MKLGPISSPLSYIYLTTHVVLNFLKTLINTLNTMWGKPVAHNTQQPNNTHLKIVYMFPSNTYKEENQQEHTKSINHNIIS